MNAMKLLMPLRVPELAPSLGRIIVPRRLLDPWVPLDDIREELATRALELGGEGRAAAARETDGQADRTRVLEVTGRRAWSAAWDHAVRRAGTRVAEALDAEITRAAREVRMPRRRLRRHLRSLRLPFRGLCRTFRHRRLSSAVNAPMRISSDIPSATAP